ncbi:MAG: helix-turn-helix domain-containing protein [Oscillospiraceae bacterium]|nr:helix-turn-helix domain-containing protein [Oscillospiraceae bacterium]
MENKKSFGAYIKAKRAESNLTQKEFADILYVTESAVSKWERGLSYPDITLIMEISRVLNVSERELLTASEDMQTRQQERLANRYLSLIKKIKITLIFLYVVPIITCFIVNLAVSGALTWFFIVLSSVMVAASLTLLPVYIEKKRGLITLGAFTGTLIILLGVCAVYTGGNWFWVTVISVVFGLSVLFTPFVLRGFNLPSPLFKHKAALSMGIDTVLLFLMLFVIDLYVKGGWFLTTAVPIAAFWLLLPWGYTLIIRYTKINRFFKTAGCMALSSATLYFMRGLTDMILGLPYTFGFDFDFSVWNINTVNGNIDAILIFTMFGLAIIFAAAGVMRQLQKTGRS